MISDLLHCLNDVAEATRPLRVPDFAGAATGGDVVPHPLSGLRGARLFDFGSNVRFILVEAVADHTCARGFLLPNPDAKIIRFEDLRSEVNDAARRV